MIISTRAIVCVKGNDMRKAKIFITLLCTFVMLVSACGKAEEADRTSPDSTSEKTSENISDNTTGNTSPTIDTYTEEDLARVSGATIQKEMGEAVEQIYSETIEYGEVYNDNGLIIKTKDYVHTPEECYIIFEFNNTTENKIEIYEQAYSVNERMDYYDTFSLILEANESKIVKMDMSYVLQTIIEEDRNVKRIKSLLLVYDKVAKNGYYPFIEIKTSIDDGIVVFKEYPVVYEDDKVAIEYMGCMDDVLYFNIRSKSLNMEEYSLDRMKIGEEMIYTFDAEMTKGVYLESYFFKERIFPNCKGELDIQIIGYDKDINELKEFTLYLIDETAYREDINGSYTLEIPVVLED